MLLKSGDVFGLSENFGLRFCEEVGVGPITLNQADYQLVNDDISVGTLTVLAIRDTLENSLRRSYLIPYGREIKAGHTYRTGKNVFVGPVELRFILSLEDDAALSDFSLSVNGGGFTATTMPYVTGGGKFTLLWHEADGPSSVLVYAPTKSDGMLATLAKYQIKF